MRSTANDETAHGNIDAFLTKFTPSGTVAWSRLFASPYDRRSGQSMVLGRDGFLYVSGQTMPGDDTDFVVFKMARS